MNFKLRFATTISLISLLITLPFILLISSNVNNLLMESADQQIISENNKIANEIKIKITNTKQLANSIAHSIVALKKKKKAYPQIITEILYANLINNPKLVGAWSVWEQYAWDKNDENTEITNYAPYWKNLNGKISLDTLVNFSDSLLGSYYLEPKKQRKTIVIPPTEYIIDNQKHIIASIASPLIFENDFKAVIGIDFDYIFFQSTLDNFNYNNAINQAISNSDGRILAHTDKTKIGTFIKETGTQLFSEDDLLVLSRAIKKSKSIKRIFFSKEQNEKLAVFVTPIEIPNLSSKISMLMSIPIKKLYAEKSLFNKQMVLYTILGIFLFFSASYFYSYLFVKPINRAIGYINSIGENGNAKIEQKYNELKNEKGKLFQSIENMHSNLIEKEKKREKENNTAEWIRNGQSKLYNSMRGLFSVQDMSKNILSVLCKYLDIQIGALYLHYERTKYLKLSAAYSLTYDDNVSNFINIGEGLVGQAALDKKITSVENIKSEYFYSSSSTLKILPKNIIILPFLLNNKVIGVLEFGSYKKIDGKKLKLLKEVLENIAIALNSMMITKKILRHRRNKKH